MRDTELELIQSRESLEFALASGQMGTWDIDLATGEVTCSKEMLELWGIEPHHFKNQRSALQSKVHPDDREVMSSAIDTAIANRSVYEFEYRIFPTEGNMRWVVSRGRCTFAPNSDQPVRFAGVAYDITEKKQKEIELTRALKARNDFFTIASHELNTPITCLNLLLQVMEFQLKKLAQNKQSPGVIEDSVQKQKEQLTRISRIVNNILDDSKISEGRLQLQLEELDLAEMAGKVIDQIRLTAEMAGVTVSLKAAENVRGNWDRFRLEQVLLNLLMNALRYGKKTPISVEVSRDADKALLTVRDQGVGIKPEDQSRIFKKFERANPELEMNGMGLGLYISSNIISAHSGKIRVNSEFGKGSEFAVVLPCSPHA